MWKWIIVGFLILAGFTSWFMHRPVHHEPGIIAPNEPVQKIIENAQPFDFKGFKITPLAQFSLEARILSRKRYRFGQDAKLSPIDLALGWKQMSNEAVLSKLKMSQEGRFTFWEAKELPIPVEEISGNASNMHLVPADKKTEKTLFKVRPGQIISISGYLIKAELPNGWNWSSSLSRTDTGRGACELVWVENASIGNR